jgi:hypothetical protein
MVTYVKGHEKRITAGLSAAESKQLAELLSRVTATVRQ